MIMALLAVAGLANLITFIIVLIRLFKEEGAGKGILGLICGIYTYWWGWKNATRLDMADAQAGKKGPLTYKNVMLVWTVALLIQIVLNRVAAA